jgi:hypothetical protein
MDVSSASTAAAYAPQQPVKPKNFAQDLARVHELAAIMSDGKRSVDERVQARHDLNRITFMGKIRGASPEDVKPIEAAMKTDLIRREQVLHQEMSDAMREAEKAGKPRGAATLAYFDSLSEEDQKILFGGINAPCYQDLSRIEIDEPTQAFKSEQEWRDMLLANDKVGAFYKSQIEGVDNLSPETQALWDKIRAFDSTHDNVRDGSWAKEMFRLLEGQKMDKVEISPEAKLLMNREAKAPTLEADKLGETNESIALMVLEKAQEARDAKDGKEERVRERPAFTVQQAQGSIVDVSI